MSFYRAFVKPLVMRLPPETAHHMAVSVLKNAPCCFPADNIPECPVTVWGKKFPRPLGLAAGFDKDAEAVAGLSRLGFGFLELGTVTPKPQPGNDKPRIFRDKKTHSLINRMGFPGKGVEEFRKSLGRHQPFSVPIGINIGKNKRTETAEGVFSLRPPK